MQGGRQEDKPHQVDQNTQQGCQHAQTAGCPHEELKIRER